MKRQIKGGGVDVSLYLFILDSTSTTGAGKTGLVFNSAGLVCYYVRPLGSATALTLITQTVTGAHADGGFIEIDATNMPGIYRLDLSDAIIAAGKTSVTVMLKGATGMAPLPLELELVAYDPDDTVRLGLTSLPNAAAEAAGGLFTRGSGAGQINQAANGMIDTNPVRLNNVAQSLLDLKDFADDGYDPATNKVQGVVLVDTLTTYTGNTPQTGDAFARLGAPAGASVSVDVAAIKAETASIQADTNDLQTRTPAALVGGRMDSSVGAMGTDVLTSGALAASAVTEIQAGLSTLDAAGVRSAVGLASANLDTQLDTLPTAMENADALLKRDWTAVVGEASRSVLNALRFLRNKWSIAGTTLTVTKEDDTTTAFTSALTATVGANPITASDPS
jgi:hypothetical protein